LYNKVFQAVNDCRLRYRVLKGSAGSGKSVNIAQDYIEKLSDPKFKGANLVVLRKIEETNRNSTFAELQAAIFRRYGSDYEKVWKITLSPLTMTCHLTGNQIIFRGMKDRHQREKIKSITFKSGKLTWLWLEEATEFLKDDIEILDDRLRGDLSGLNPNLYYQITFTFNPVSATHWLKAKYFDKADADVLAHHSTYKDNEFIDDAYAKRMARRKIEDPEGYRIYGLGQWGELGGLILTRFEIHSFPTDAQEFDAFYYGQDFGYNHANAILDIGSRDGEIYICSELYKFETDTNELITLAERAGIHKNVEMWCDSAEPDRIKMWRTAGFRARGVKKSPGSVKAQIDFLKGKKIHIHPSCVNTIKEIRQWKWKKDTSTDKYIDEPVEFMDDAMAALRYGIERLRRKPSIRALE
jgi:phage terminase large subunit